MPTTRSGEKPTNQASFSSLVVPVLPAIGLPTSLTHGRGAGLHHAFHHRGDLVGRHRIQHLLAAIDQLRLGLVLPAAGRVAAAAFARVVLEDGVAVAILDAIDQGRLHAAAAIGEHRIGRDHPHHRGFAGAERIGQVVRQFVIDAEAPGIFADQGHADVLRQPHRHRVERQPQRVAQRHRSLVFAATNSFPAARRRRPAPGRFRSARRPRRSTACSRCPAPPNRRSA